MTVQAYNKIFLPAVEKAGSFINRIKKIVSELEGQNMSQEEILRLFEYYGWSEDTVSIINKALALYKDERGVKKLDKFDKPFIEACLKGEALPENVDDYVEYWHTHIKNLTLREFLGFTKEEYQEFAINKLTNDDQELIQLVIESRRTGRPFDELHETARHYEEFAQELEKQYNEDNNPSLTSP